MRTITKTVYKFSELSESAKHKAIERYRDSNAGSGDNFWSEHLLETEFPTIASGLGWTIAKPKGRSGLAIYWSGFWSQGDGLAFEGVWRAADIDTLALRKVYAVNKRSKAYQHLTPVERHHADELHSLIDRYAAIKKAGRTAYADATTRRGNRGTVSATSREEEHQDLYDDLCHYFYKQLEREYEYQTSDESIAETLEANEYEFDEEGEMN